MSTAKTTYVYGPVPSRRLGRSLGVDLIPYKTCSYDCIYCQLGRTTRKTIARKEYAPIENIIKSVKERLAESVRPDYITLAGSGEPTLHSGLGELITRLKGITDIPLAVITNGSLLWDHTVRQNLQDADIVLPSLDAGDEVVFELINRPHRSISFSKMVDGITTFVREFHGQVWLEIMLLAEINSTESAIENIAALTRQINPARLQLNSVFRPGAETYAPCLSRERLEKIASFSSGEVDIVSEPIQNNEVISPIPGGNNTAILSLLERRPCTIADIATGLSLHPTEVVKLIDKLLHDKKVCTTKKGDLLFYKLWRDANNVR